MLANHKDPWVQKRAHMAGAGDTGVSLTCSSSGRRMKVEAMDQGAPKAGARAHQGPSQAARGTSKREHEHVRVARQRATKRPRSQARAAYNKREWTPAENSGHNVPFPHGQSGEQGRGGGSASDTCPTTRSRSAWNPNPTQYISVAHLDLGPSSTCNPNAEQRERLHSQETPSADRDEGGWVRA